LVFYDKFRETDQLIFLLKLKLLIWMIYFVHVINIKCQILDKNMNQKKIKPKYFYYLLYLILYFIIY